MPGPEFLDTNILVYAYDAASPAKQRVAQGLVRAAIAGRAIISTQVLSEFAATLLHKASPPISPSELLVLLDALAPIRALFPDADIIRRAVDARAAYGIHFYDGLIVATAEKAGCKRIWSEDLNSGQRYFGVTVENPFS
jgi:predicted nucleic acid-binding protein